MIRRTAYVLAAVAPSLGWAAASFPRSTADVLTLLVAGWFVALASVALPRRMGVVVIAWWVLVVACWAHVWLPWVTGFWWFSWVGPVHVPVFADEVVKPSSFFLAGTWWALAFAPVVRGFLDTASVSAPESEPEEVTPPSRRVRDLTRVEVPASGAALRPDGQVHTLAPDRYADVVIGDPDEDDDEDELSLLKQVADLFPDRRRSETGKVSVRDVADRLDMTVPEVTGRLAQDGVPVARLNGVTPLAGGGSASAMNAVRWVDISRAAGAIPPRDRAEIGDHSNPRRQGT